MTTQDLINSIAQGAPITARMAREIVTHLHRLHSTEDALLHAIAACADLQSRIRDKVMFTAEEVAWLESALADAERLKDAVRWERECYELWDFGPVISDRACDELIWSLNAARDAVEELI